VKEGMAESSESFWGKWFYGWAEMILEMVLGGE